MKKFLSILAASAICLSTSAAVCAQTLEGGYYYDSKYDKFGCGNNYVYSTSALSTNLKDGYSLTSSGHPISAIAQTTYRCYYGKNDIRTKIRRGTLHYGMASLKIKYESEKYSILNVNTTHKYSYGKDFVTKTYVSQVM